VITSLPAFLDPPSASVIVAVVVSSVLGVVAIVLIRRPESRAQLS
jgi:hypothetical protein